MNREGDIVRIHLTENFLRLACIGNFNLVTIDNLFFVCEVERT